MVIFEELITLLFVLLSHLVWQRRWIATRKTTSEGGCLLGCSVHHQAKRVVCHAQKDHSHKEVRRDGTAISSESKASTRRQSDEVAPRRVVCNAAAHSEEKGVDAGQRAGRVDVSFRGGLTEQPPEQHPPPQDCPTTCPRSGSHKGSDHGNCRGRGRGSGADITSS